MQSANAASIPAEGVLKAGVYKGFGNLLGASCKAHALLGGIIVCYALADLIFVAPYTNRVDSLVMLVSFATVITTIPVMLLVLIATRFVRLAVYIRPDRPLSALYHDVKGYVSQPQRLANGLPVMVLLFAFINIYSHIKANIPIMAPFSWDETFMVWDRWLHFGVQPWEWLQPVLGFAPVTYVLNFVYNLWFVVMWAVWVWFGFGQGPSELRTRFLLTFFVTWMVGGSLVAILMSSAGPCYYALLALGSQPYGELMAYLHGVNQVIPLWAIETQDMLWQAYVQQSNNAGISAMPSMHNATTLLFALAGWHLGRGYGWALSIFAGLIFIGSIHLGWHYAIDAYVGFAITAFVWWISLPIARWWHRHPWSVAYDGRLAQSGT